MRRGFTWIELLVILVVLLVAVMLAMPVFLHVREASWRARCLSHLRTLSASLDVYAVNNSDRLPLSMPADSKRLYPRKEATVPAKSAADNVYWANTIGAESDALTCPTVDANVAFAYNGYLHAFRTSDVRDKGSAICLWAGFGKSPRNVSLPRLECVDVSLPCDYNQSELATIAEPPLGSVWTHGRGSTFLFLDGHAEWRRLGATAGTPTDPKLDPFHTYDGAGRVDKFWLDSDGRAPFFKP